MPTMNQTSLYFSIAPRSKSSQGNNAGGHTYSVYGEGSDTVLRSVNSPIILQMFWDNSTTTLTQEQEGTGGGGERQTNDLVNVLFDIYEANTYKNTPVIPDDFNKICTIKKPKDSPMKWNASFADKVTLKGHRFTINISEILADLLSYSLVPVGIGTWGCIDMGGTGPQVNGGSTSTYVATFGGMNGQWVDSNVASTASNQHRYNLSANGSDRVIKVEARFEILAADGTLVLSTSPATKSFSNFFICNAAPQWGDRHDLKNREISTLVATYAIGPYFLTNSPNAYGGDAVYPDKQYYKPIRLDDNAEYLQWFQKKITEPPTGKHIDGLCIVVEYSANADMSSSSTLYLTDCTAKNRAYVSSGNLDEDQYRQFVQNVSPAYINQHNNGTQPNYGAWGTHLVTPLTVGMYYRCAVFTIDSAVSPNEKILSAYQYYHIEEETKGGWSDVCGMKEGVKFMWLNRMGGIDSYTAKRIFSKSIDVQRETITKKSPDRLHSQNINITGLPFNNNIGANMYPHSREVLNVDANRKFSAMTDPLTIPEANWLEELLTSPNVWVIQENDGSKYLEGRTAITSGSRPSTQGYMPIVITSSDVVLIDEAEGLSQINIEFIESHKINTQRN